MPSSRALFLKGILGVAGLGVSSAGGIGLGLGKTFTEGQKDQATAADSSSESVDAGDIVAVEVEDADLGFPEGCDTSCSLTAEQLKNLKFKKSGDKEIEFKGLKDGDEFELTIEKSEDEINYPKGKKYTLKPKTISGPITIKNVEEADIVFESGKEVLIRETEEGGKLEHILDEINELGIPRRCVGEQATTECELTQLQLQKLDFEIRDGEVKTVEGLDEGNFVTLKIEDKKDDRDNYPHGKKYTLTSNRYVLMGGVKGGDILLENGKEFVIREKKEGGKLELLLEEVDRLGIPRRCEADQVKDGTKTTCPLIQKQLKDLKFEPKEGSQISVEGWNDNSKFELEIEVKKDDLTNYPKGKKYTLKPKTGTATIRGIKDGDITIWDDQSLVNREKHEKGEKLFDGQWVVIRETSEGGKLEKAPEEVDDLGIPRSCTPGKICNLNEYQIKNLQFEKGDDEAITVDGLKEGKVVTLRIEDKSNDKANYPEGKKYTLSVRKGTVTIKGLKEGDITVGKEAVAIRKKEGVKKLEKAPEELNNLGIPRRCEALSICDLTKAQLQRLKFETNGASSISVEGLNDGETVKLRIETQGDVTNYPGGKKYTFTSTGGKVTIRNTKDGDIVLEGNKGVVFRATKDQNKLETYLDILGIPRDYGGEGVKKASDSKTYHLSSEELKNLKFENFGEKTGDVKVTGLTGRDKIKLTISWSEDRSKYPDNRKYSFDNTASEDITISKGEGEVTEIKIAKQKESWFKNNGGQLEFVEAKSKSQIAKESELTEVTKILKSLGLEKLEIGDFTGDTRNPKMRKQTNVEFKNESDLKKIQFKDLGGGADTVTGLSGLSIRVYLEWHSDAKKFPYNMKFLFENQRFSLGGFKFMKGYKSPVVIHQKDATNLNNKNIFKIEKIGNQDKWYLVRTSDK